MRDRSSASIWSAISVNPLMSEKKMVSLRRSWRSTAS